MPFGCQFAPPHKIPVSASDYDYIDVNIFQNNIKQLWLRTSVSAGQRQYIIGMALKK